MEKENKQYCKTRYYRDLTKRARGIVDAVSDLPIWQDIINDFDGCPASIHYEARQGWHGQFPHSLHFASSRSKVPQCMFEVDYNWSPEQCRMMLDWERKWVYDDAWSASPICTWQYNAKAELENALLPNLSDLKFKGYLVGSYGRRFNETLTIEPIWRADSVMAHIHCRNLDGIDGCELIKITAPDTYALSATLENHLLGAVKQRHLTEDCFVVIPKKLLPAEFIELETQIESQAIFPQHKKLEKLA